MVVEILIKISRTLSAIDILLMCQEKIDVN